ncbi:uncharacterized protein LOC144095185 [Amblyomma americanum]
MPKIKIEEKAYARAKASRETKVLFENFGRCSRQRTVPVPAASVASSAASTVSSAASSDGATTISDAFFDIRALRNEQVTAVSDIAATPELPEVAPAVSSGFPCSSASSCDTASEDPADCPNPNPATESRDLVTALRAWALKENISHSALSSLLKLLKAHPFDTTCLPSDARTLLRTPRETMNISALTAMPPGEYCHYGLEHQLRNMLSHRSLEGSMLVEARAADCSKCATSYSQQDCCVDVTSPFRATV